MQNRSNKLDTTCGSVMNLDAKVVHLGDTVATALGMLIKNRVLGLPIVDRQQRYRGMFLKSKLISRLLPAAATIGEETHRISQLPDIAFLTLTVEDLRQSFAAIADQPVESLIDVKTPVLRPDSPLSSAVLDLYRTRNFVPVVEKGTERLVGVISTWDLLGRLSVDDEAPLPAA